MKKLLFNIVAFVLAISAVAPTATAMPADGPEGGTVSSSTEGVQIQVAPKDKGIFNHMDLGLNVGTSGIGLDASMPLTKYLRVHAGVSYMPQFVFPMTFNVESYVDGSVVSTKFDRMQELMYQMTGVSVDREVKMTGKATMVDFKLLVDVFPWAEFNDKWHLTVGFYLGSRCIGKAINVIEEMPSLLAIQMYNRMYESFINEEYLDKEILPGIMLEPEVGDKLRDKFASYGTMGVHVGDRVSDGTPYMMVPGEDGTVRANMYVNRFKPYLGVGYNAPVTRDGRLKVGFDLGMLMWGGSPKIVTHEGVDLVNDVKDIKGKVGDYVSIASALKVYPVLNFKISYNLF